MTEPASSGAGPSNDWSPAPMGLDEVLSVDWLTRALGVGERGAVIKTVEEVDRVETTASKVRIRVVTEDADGHLQSETLLV